MNKILLLAVFALMSAMNVTAQTEQLTSADEEVIKLRGCRMGIPNPRFTPRRSQLSENGETLYVGNRRQMVVLVSFQDRDFKEDHNTAMMKWDRIFNEENYNEEMFIGSVHDYFLAQSYEQLNLAFDLTCPMDAGSAASLPHEDFT